MLNGVDVELSLNEASDAVDIRAYTKSIGPTGVEMEALTAVAISALTIYDMCKSVSKDIEISAIRLLAKTGGQSGDYLRRDEATPSQVLNGPE
jgi:molybdenum cofactor biosynthesis protein MoaC